MGLKARASSGPESVAMWKLLRACHTWMDEGGSPGVNGLIVSRDYSARHVSIVSGIAESEEGDGPSAGGEPMMVEQQSRWEEL